MDDEMDYSKISYIITEDGDLLPVDPEQLYSFDELPQEFQDSLNFIQQPLPYHKSWEEDPDYFELLRQIHNSVWVMWKFNVYETIEGDEWDLENMIGRHDDPASYDQYVKRLQSRVAMVRAPHADCE